MPKEVKEVKTANGTTYQFTGPLQYVRVRNGVAKEHSCLAWGAVLPAKQEDLAGQGLVLGGLMPTSFGITMLPMTMRIREVVPGAPLCFMVERDGRLVLHLSTPVVEVGGQSLTPEGVATELPEHLQKLLSEEEEGEKDSGE